jgi:hypothetical protein
MVVSDLSSGGEMGVRACSRLTLISTTIAIPAVLAGCSGLTPAGQRSATSHTVVPATALPTPGLPSDQAKFVSDLRAHMAAHSLASTATDARLAKVGTSICSALAAGAPQKAVISAAGKNSQSAFAYTGKQLVALALRDICPEAKPRVVATFSGSGSMNTARFDTGTNWTLIWSYDCAAAGQASNFIVRTRSIASTPDANGAAVNEPGIRGHGTTKAHNDAGFHYFAVTASGCTWKLKVVTA